MSQRIEKANSLIQEIVAEIIRKDLSLKPSVFVSILKVDTSSDLRYARVFLSVYPASEGDYAFKTLQKELHRIQKALNQKLQMKILPKIIFQLDNTQEKVDQLEEIFQKIKEEDKQDN